MVASPNQWTARGVQPVNEWISVLDMWMLHDAVWGVQERLREERNHQFQQCLYGGQAKSLSDVSAVCGVARPVSLTSIRQASQEIAAARIYPGVSEIIGSPQLSNVAVSQNSISSPVAIALMEAPVAAVAGQSAGHRRLSSSSQTINDASCYAVVRNDADYLVGQLLGSCVSVQAAPGTVFSNGVELCLRVRSETQRATALYPALDFAVRSSSASGFSYKPAGFTTLRDTGSHLCATIYNANTFYCPSLRANGFATKQADVGTSGCAAMDSLVSEVSAANVATTSAANVATNVTTTTTQAPGGGGGASSGTAEFSLVTAKIVSVISFLMYLSSL